MSTETISNPPVVGRLLSVQIGQPQTMKTAKGRVWQSAIGKEPVSGTVAVGSENVAGDKQANRKFHGGPDKAVCCYSHERYAVWLEEFDLQMPTGAFGENLTVEGLLEENVCMGDVLSVGTVRLQISQPRMPCANVAKRWNCQKLPERMMVTGYTGFYCRVLQTGEITAGDTITIIERSLPEWTIARMNRVLFDDATAPSEQAELRAVSLLTREWKNALGRRLSDTD